MIPGLLRRINQLEIELKSIRTVKEEEEEGKSTDRIMEYIHQLEYEIEKIKDIKDEEAKSTTRRCEYWSIYIIMLHIVLISVICKIVWS